MLRPQRLLEDRQRPLIQRPGLAVGTSVFVQIGEIAERLCRLWMLQSERFFVDRQRPLIQRLGLGVGTGLVVQIGKICLLYTSPSPRD